MPSRQITDLCEELQPLAVQFLSRCNGDTTFQKGGFEAFISCTYRSNEEQNRLYAQGRTQPGKVVTKARGGQSPHNCVEAQKPAARAFDIAIRYRGSNNLLWDASSPLWRRAVAIGEGLGLESGSAWGDWPHFQLKNWKIRDTSSPKV